MSVSVDEHVLVYEPDFRSRALRRLYIQWQDKPRLRSFVRALGRGTQALESEVFALITGRTIDTAFGAALDQWGELVGEPRGGLNDDEYRLMIEIRIFANRCRGTTDDLIYILQRTTAPSTVRHVTLYPAGGKLYVYRSEWMSDARSSRVGRLIRDVKPAGVACPVIECIPGHLGWDTGWTENGLDISTSPMARLI